MIRITAEIVTTNNEYETISLLVGDNLYTEEMQLDYIKQKYNTPIITNLHSFREE